MSAKKKTKLKKSKKASKGNFHPYFVHYVYCLAIIFLLTITTININKYLDNKKVLGASIDATSIQNEKSYWQQIVGENPTYIDGYLELAKVDMELGNKTEAGMYINKALELDPNSSKIPEVVSQLGI